MSTLAVVEDIIRENAAPMTVRQIVERAGPRLPSKSRTPDTVVARDLSMDIKKRGSQSIFVRVSPGLYDLRFRADESLRASTGNAPTWPAGDLMSVSRPTTFEFANRP